MEFLTNPTTWMFFVLVILAGIWAEIRYRMGGNAALLSPELSEVIEEIKFKGEVHGAKTIIKTFIDAGLVTVDDKGAYTGLGGNVFHPDDYLKKNATPEMMKMLEEYVDKYSPGAKQAYDKLAQDIEKDKENK